MKDRYTCPNVVCLLIRDWSITVSMVDFHFAITLEVEVKDVGVAMVPPPGTQLSVIGTVQNVKELHVLHSNQREEVLVAKVTLEVILVCKFPYLLGIQELIVKSRLPHGLEIEQQHSAVETREAVWWGIANFSVRVLLAVLPKGVPVNRLHFPGDTQNSSRLELVKLFKQLPDVRHVLHIQVQLHNMRQLCWHDSVHGHGQEEN